ncbi:nickel transporter [Sphaerotilus microaerophilus]|uniref:Nickel transporter n=2 Tax=Sphaerotilus microaerophilus TaxID=2914710 RepID=A0ABM7YQ04_9BURK|nr:nickel transporter [Sphaerotilus sp. FB-5]
MSALFPAVPVIPVLDLMRGQVVRAVRGERQHYPPMHSQLRAGSDPVELARALCHHTGSDRLYIADLDALLGGEAQTDVLRRLIAALPGVRLWLDAGWADAAAAHALWAELGAAGEAIDPVYASEALRDAAALAGCFTADDALGTRALLSLDRRAGQPLDRAGCWQRPDLWPQRVIVMTLERVGSDAGPDLQTLPALHGLAPQRQFIGSGGIRHPDDLRAAAGTGATGWLVASALHDGRLPAQARP